MDKKEIITKALAEFDVKRNRIHAPMSTWNGEHVLAFAWWPERGDSSWSGENQTSIEHYQVDKYTRRAFRVKAWLEVSQTTDGLMHSFFMDDAQQRKRAAFLDTCYCSEESDDL